MQSSAVVVDDTAISERPSPITLPTSAGSSTPEEAAIDDVDTAVAKCAKVGFS